MCRNRCKQRKIASIDTEQNGFKDEDESSDTTNNKIQFHKWKPLKMYFRRNGNDCGEKDKEGRKYTKINVDA